MKAGELMPAVQAKGFAPALRTIPATGSLAELESQLGLGQLLGGRVTDKEGNPITNAFVETTRRAFDKIEWSANVGSDDRFEWDSAPFEPLLYSFQAEGFNRGYALPLQADGAEPEIKLTRHQPDKDRVQVAGTLLESERRSTCGGF
jgi:hypothetical protein